MIYLIFGIPLSLFGALAFTRGWIYTLRPEGPMAIKRREKNIDKGFPSDMKYFGKRVRRFGYLCLLIGGGLIVAFVMTRPSSVPAADAPQWTEGETP